VRRFRGWSCKELVFKVDTVLVSRRQRAVDAWVDLFSLSFLRPRFHGKVKSRKTSVAVCCHQHGLESVSDGRWAVSHNASLRFLLLPPSITRTAHSCVTIPPEQQALLKETHTHTLDRSSCYLRESDSESQRLSARTRFPQIFRLARKIIRFDLILLSGTESGRRKIIPVPILPSSRAAANSRSWFLIPAKGPLKEERHLALHCYLVVLISDGVSRTLSSPPFCTPFSIPGALPFLTVLFLPPLHVFLVVVLCPFPMA
jgi:hypothetical protein